VIALALLAVFGVLAGFYCFWRGGLIVLGSIRPGDLSSKRKDQVLYGGTYWDKDVYQSAMNDLKRQERSGVALDGESRRALRRHQGMK